MTTFSVLICTYNRPELLTMSLAALVEGTTEKPDQVVVVNGGDDQADEIVKKYAEQTRVEMKLVKTFNKNLATSRNIGLEHCTGEIIAMTDDDAEVFPNWVTMMKKIHAERPEAGGVGGAILGAASSASLLSRMADISTFSSPPAPCYVRTIAGVNVSYKRAALASVGKQDETLFRGEDVDFNWRIKQLGYEIYYHPDIKVRHHHRPTFKGMLNQFYMYGRAYYLVRLKWLNMYCIYPHEIKKPFDLLKLINVAAGIFYQPFITAMKLPSLLDRIASVPAFFLFGISWRWGMIEQKYLPKKRS